MTINKELLMRLVVVLFLLTATLLAFIYREHLDFDSLDRWLAGAGWKAPFLFMTIYAIATVLFLPGAVITLAGGALFGPLWGTLYNLVGATIGAALSFLVSRYIAGDWVQKRLGGKSERLVKGVEEEGWRFIAFTRLVPLFPFNLLNYALGLTRIPFLQYVAASFVFMFPGALAYTWLGFAGREAAEGGENLIRTGLIALALLATAAFIPRIVKQWRKQ
jgi:uncharacterized membrane protein YdjX (TVP38/TMEM64 family)